MCSLHPYCLLSEMLCYDMFPCTFACGFILLTKNSCWCLITAVVSVATSGALSSDEGEPIDRPVSTFIPGAPRLAAPAVDAVPAESISPAAPVSEGGAIATIASASKGIKASNNSLSSLSSEKTVHADDIMVVMH